MTDLCFFGADNFSMNSCRNPSNRARVEGKFDITGTIVSMFNELAGLKNIKMYYNILISFTLNINLIDRLKRSYFVFLSCAPCGFGFSQQYPTSKLSSNSFQRSPLVLII